MENLRPSGTVDFSKNQSMLMKLALKTTLLTFLTLGIYRFWARTRIRRYFWSAVTLDGHGFEYTGRGIEKFLGFLIAVAVLAIYLGLFQLLLSFAGMSLISLGDPSTDELEAVLLTYATFFALLPLIFYAQYRARRYMLSRTRWKGIRFGAEKAAWGYTWRALGHLFLTIITLGILLPRQTFYLEKYKTDRTWFGSAQFQQNGRWQSLYPAMKHIFIGAVLLIATIITGIKLSGSVLWLGIAASILGMVWIYFGMIYYGVHSHRILTSHKTLDNDITFTSEPKTGTVIGIFIIGTLIILFLGGIISAAIGFIGSLIGNVILSPFDTGLSEMPAGSMVGFILGYILFFVTAGVLGLVYITQPLIEHYATQTHVQNAEKLTEIEQREGDDVFEAEGFADALDIGAGI